jgi:hypothetical protein
LKNQKCGLQDLDNRMMKRSLIIVKRKRKKVLMIFKESNGPKTRGARLLKMKVRTIRKLIVKSKR